jgi:sigma-B regulation protein RsbU (phosphoserine phosphatase)
MLANLRDWVRVRASINLAMEVQRRLLPTAAPRVAGFDIAGYSAYCDETGGDYYDFVLNDPAKPERFIVALGDVMGHGLPSALLMAGARGILRSGVSTHALPGSLLAHINNLLYQDTAGEGFMTMCVASFDLTTATCTWASAGHDPPIVFDAVSHDFRELEGGGVPLGLFEDGEFSDYQFGPVAAGQVIVIGSDGVWETFSPNGDKFGKDRLEQIMATYAARSAEEIKNALIAALKDFRGNAPVRDDVTFVILKIVG